MRQEEEEGKCNKEKNVLRENDLSVGAEGMGDQEKGCKGGDGPASRSWEEHTCEKMMKTGK